MLSFIKKMFQSAPAVEGSVAVQSVDVPFPWPCGAQLTALEPVTIAIPAAAITDGEKTGSVIHGDPNVEVRLPTKPGDSLILIRMKEGSFVSLSKSVQGMVIADDKAPKRIRVRPPLEDKP